MKLLAIDPGNERSAYVVYAGRSILEKGIVANDGLLQIIDRLGETASECVIEMIASYGMAVGREVFETCVWIGRFAERWESQNGPAVRLVRRDVRMHLCGANNAKDGNIRAALIDAFGPGKEKAIGKKATPGPLYGVRADEWAALALAVTFAETKRAS